MSSRLSLTAFVVLTVLGGIAAGLLNPPDAWYVALNKPVFNPPNWLFGPVWTMLYVLIGIAGWRTWHSHRHSLAMKLWWGQMALNLSWSPAFFGAHRMGLALLVVVTMLATIVAFVVTSWRRDPTAAHLFLPYGLWVAFASVLNATLLWLN
jgi:tryptophan-rich sensory protein